VSRRSPRPAGAKRHKWVKVRLHVYICRQCGMGSVNAQDSRGGWFTTYHKPDGTSAIERHVPACERGSLTDAYLKKHESAIAGADVARAGTTVNHPIENGATA
jgi:hypothetical protein